MTTSFGVLPPAACLLIVVLCTFAGCSQPNRDDIDHSYSIYQSFSVSELNDAEIYQFETVFWEPDDTESLRKLIVDDAIADGRNVLEIGTGTGYLSLICLSEGAASVIATDINPSAVANAKYNAAMMELEENLEVRLVDKKDPGAFSVMKPTERFDLILSNPPWENGTVTKRDEHALYDPGFALMDSLLQGLPQRLNPGGRCLLAYGHKPAITRLLSRAKEMGLSAKVLDDRNLDELPDDFLPGMLIEVRLGKKQSTEKVKAEVARDKNSES